MATLNALDQVKLDAELLTRKRIEEAEESKKWQESVDGHLSLDDEQPVEATVEVEKPKTVKKKKG